MKILKTYEGYTRKEDEKYPYPIYYEALMEFLPSVFLFNESENFSEDNLKRFACNISDFTNLPPEAEKGLPGFANNYFDDEGIDFLEKVETQAADRFDKILVGGIPTPWMGGRTPDRLDIHGDSLYFFGEETNSNTSFLKELCTENDEFDYYDGFYRVWWD